jgi:Amidase
MAALAGKHISSVELTDFAIARIDSLDKPINAVVVRDFERARAAAKAPDAALARGETRPLLGLPMIVKEAFSRTGRAVGRGRLQAGFAAGAAAGSQELPGSRHRHPSVVPDRDQRAGGARPPGRAPRPCPQ